MIRRVLSRIAVAAVLCVELGSAHAVPFRFDQTSVSANQVKLTLSVADSAELETTFGLAPGDLQLADIGAAVYFPSGWSANPLVTDSVSVSLSTEYFTVITDPDAFGVQYLVNASIAPVMADGVELFSFVVNRPNAGFGVVSLGAVNFGYGLDILRADEYGLLAQTTVSAVPEPGSYAFMLSGIVLIGAMARRARKH